MRKKIIKYVSVLVACIIAFSLFTIPASAELVDPSVELNGMEINQIYISVISSVGIETYLPVNLYPVLNEDVGYIFVEAVLNGTNLDSNEIYTLNTTLLTRTYLENYENYVVGSYCVYLDNRYVTPLESVNSYRAGKKENEVSYSHNQRATVSASNKWEREGYKYSFDAGVLGVGYDLYSSYIKFKPVDSTRKSLQIYIYNIDFDVISPQEYSGQQIIDSQDKNTDKILNGDSDLDSSGETNKVNGTVGGINDATDEALGGKTDAEIQKEIGDTLDPKTFDDIDWNKAQRMSTFFDRCLNAFGLDYKMLLLLALTLGLSAFLIGRRYG